MLPGYIRKEQTLDAPLLELQPSESSLSASVGSIADGHTDAVESAEESGDEEHAEENIWPQEDGTHAKASTKMTH